MQALQPETAMKLEQVGIRAEGAQERLREIERRACPVADWLGLPPYASLMRLTPTLV
jgi:hypothetical protein